MAIDPIRGSTARGAYRLPEEVTPFLEIGSEVAATLSMATVSHSLTQGLFRPNLPFIVLTTGLAVLLGGISTFTQANEGKGVSHFLVEGLGGFIGGSLSGGLHKFYERLIPSSTGNRLGARVIHGLARALLSHIALTVGGGAATLLKDAKEAEERVRHGLFTAEGLFWGWTKMAAFGLGKGGAQRLFRGRVHASVEWFTGTYGALVLCKGLESFCSAGFSTTGLSPEIFRNALRETHQLSFFDVGTGVFQKASSLKVCLSQSPVRLPLGLAATSALLVAAGHTDLGLSLSALAMAASGRRTGEEQQRQFQERQKQNRGTAVSLTNLYTAACDALQRETAAGVETARQILGSFRRVVSSIPNDRIREVDGELNGGAKILLREIRTEISRGGHKGRIFRLPAPIDQLVGEMPPPVCKPMRDVLIDLMILERSRGREVGDLQIAYALIRTFTGDNMETVFQAIQTSCQRRPTLREALHRSGWGLIDAEERWEIGRELGEKPARVERRGVKEPITIPDGWPDLQFTETAWFLYETFRDQWSASPDQSAPAPDFGWFRILYEGAGGLGQFREELGHLAYRVVMGALWFGPEAHPPLLKLREGFQMDPRLERSCWDFIHALLPAWPRLGFESGGFMNDQTEIESRPKPTSDLSSSRQAILVELRRTLLMASSYHQVQNYLRAHSVSPHDLREELTGVDRTLALQMAETTVSDLIFQIHQFTRPPDFINPEIDEGYRDLRTTLGRIVDESFPIASAPEGAETEAQRLIGDLLSRIEGGQLQGINPEKVMAGIVQGGDPWVPALMLRWLLVEESKAKIAEVQHRVTEAWAQREFEVFLEPTRGDRRLSPARELAREIIASVQFMGRQSIPDKLSPGREWTARDRFLTQSFWHLLQPPLRKLTGEFERRRALTERQGLWFEDEARKRLQEAVIDPLERTLDLYLEKQRAVAPGEEDRRLIDEVVAALREARRAIRPFNRGKFDILARRR